MGNSIDAIEAELDQLNAENEANEESDPERGESRAERVNAEDAGVSEGDDNRSGLSERLVADLTAHRTMVMRDMLGVKIQMPLVGYAMASGRSGAL